MRLLIPLLACVCAFGHLHGAEEPADPAADAAKLPPAAKALVDKLAKSEEKLTSDYRKGVLAERLKTIADLQKVLKDQTRKGDLDGAVAVKAAIDQLVETNERENDTDLLGNKKEPSAADPGKQMAGTWNFSKNGITGTLVFREDGGVTAQFFGLSVPGTWVVKDEAIVITWVSDPNNWDSLKLPVSDTMTGDSSDNGKNSIQAQRVKEPKGGKDAKDRR